MTRAYRLWTDADLALLRATYRADDAMGCYRLVAEQTGRSLEAVAAKAFKLGLTPRVREAWRPEERAYMDEHWGQQPGAAIARQLGRTYASVQRYAMRNGLDGRCHDGWYLPSEVRDMLGVGTHWVQRRIADGRLRARQEGNHWRIEEQALRAFVVRYSGELRGRRCDWPALVRLLTEKA